MHRKPTTKSHIAEEEEEQRKAKKKNQSQKMQLQPETMKRRRLLWLQWQFLARTLYL